MRVRGRSMGRGRGRVRGRVSGKGRGKYQGSAKLMGASLKPAKARPSRISRRS